MGLFFGSTMFRALPRMLAVAAVFASAAASAAAVPPAPLGLDPEGSEYALRSNNNGWQVNDGGLRPVKLIERLLKANPKSTDAAERQNYDVIWAPTCTAAQQKLIFERIYDLPGPAKTAGLYITDNTFGSGFGDAAIAKTRIFINGKLAVTIPGSRLDLREEVRPWGSMFKFGANLVKIEVTKRAQDGTRGRCSNGTPAKPLGLMFSLTGQFEADVWLSDDQYQVQYSYSRSRPGATSQPLRFTVSPENRGASGIYHGALTLTVGGTITSFDTTPAASGPLQNCKAGRHPTFGLQLTCDIVRLKPNGKATAIFDAVGAVRPGFNETFSATAQVRSFTRDPNGDNNGWRKIGVVCSTDSTDPKCPP